MSEALVLMRGLGWPGINCQGDNRNRVMGYQGRREKEGIRDLWMKNLGHSKKLQF